MVVQLWIVSVVMTADFDHYLEEELKVTPDMNTFDV